MSLFRQEVFEAKKRAHVGKVVLRSPAAFVWFSALAGCVAVALVAMLFTFNYTSRAHVVGKLEPDLGLVQVYPLQAGRVVSRKAREGDQIAAGSPLFLLSGERVGKLGETTAAAMRSLESRRQSLRQEIDNGALLISEQRAASQKRLIELRAQLAQLTQEADSQKRRIEISQATLARYTELAKANFVPTLQVQQRHEELLDQQSRLSALVRAAADLKSQISTTESELASLPLREKTQKAAAERSLSLLEQEAAETAARGELSVLAPVAGTVSTLQVEQGQTVTGDQALATIIPSGSSLVANFFVPSSAIAFVKPGQKVMMRYPAFPYQKFGQAEGIVSDISRSAVIRPGQPANSEPVFRITVKPALQQVMAYGRWMPLQPDMTVEADVMLDTRRLIEWIFEPLLSIKGKL
ncbi:HlyD family secretion protein [Parachitinimonas caeni]|uniref:HlyD family efflux transporter periplasmic adaptor subunit n=1 Tax=Parachitinimonas caeni TaxID=3031301 RepID=A0ABT7DV99_9NEIS|nr:HlyD family efflux transporter periplasmic adaptor subunit [Parachitinimonas caeni]MDK2122577.1 HlyD family efflux transporter periplasmic adaptor subunit [Parachitinimonas caeni]